MLRGKPRPEMVATAQRQADARSTKHCERHREAESNPLERRRLLVADLNDTGGRASKMAGPGCVWHSGVPADALWSATQGGNLEVVCRLLDAGVDLNARTPAGETALHIAAFWNVVPVVKRLLAHPNVNVNVMASKGATPLHVACHRGHSAVIILLLRHPSTAVNVGWTVSCFTPLFLAVKQVRIASPISTGHYRTQRSLMALPGCAAGKRGRGRDTSK